MISQILSNFFAEPLSRGTWFSCIIWGMGQFDYISLGFCSNDHLAVLPFIPMDTKVKMVAHSIRGGGLNRANDRAES